MFTISLGDLWRGLITAVLAAASVAAFNVLSAVILAPNFDFFSVDWVTVFKSLTNALIVSSYGGFSGYILKNLLTDKNQNFLGIQTKN